MTRINLIHAAPNAGNVDVYLDCEKVLCNFAYTDYADLAQFAGCSYKKLQVRKTGCGTVIASIPCFTFPCNGNFSLVIHWNLVGDEIVIKFYDNNINECAKTKGNFIFRHAAAIGAVNVYKSDISPPLQLYSNVEQGERLSARFLPDGTNALTIQLVSDSSVLLEVSDLEIVENKLTILYLTGKCQEFTYVTEVIDLPCKSLAYWCNIYQNVC